MFNDKCGLTQAVLEGRKTMTRRLIPQKVIDDYYDYAGCSFTFHVCFSNIMNEIMYKLGEANSNGWLDLKKLEE